MEGTSIKENIVDDCGIDGLSNGDDISLECYAGHDYTDKGKNIDKKVDDCGEPCVGMKFATKDEFHEFYKNYARRIWFGVKIRGSWKRENRKPRVVLACVREGKCRQNQNHGPSFTLCIGCKAQIAATLCEDEFWYITKVNLQHNHLISPSKSRFFRSDRHLDDHVKMQLDMNDQAGITTDKSYQTQVRRVGGPENLTNRENDVRNYIESARRLRLGEGDAAAIYQYFIRKQNENSKFFHSMDIDDRGQLRNVFWANAKCRVSYQYFGDIVSYDATYLTNKYDMPFTTFVGVNHHGQSVLLGCALLADEMVSNYEWLFSTWLQCMNGVPPNEIITDQCPSIQATVSRVFPHSRHRLCLWHIMKKVLEKLGAYKESFRIVDMMKRAVYESLRVEDFELCWSEMIQKNKLEDNSWLKSIFDIQHKWVPVYVRDSFWAEMSTTQHSKSINLFFDEYVHSKTSLKQFINQYDAALSMRYEKEAIADFKSFYKIRDLVSTLPYEKEFQSKYTNKLFAKFQEEVRAMVNCRLKMVDIVGQTSRYEVRERILIPGLSEPIEKFFEVWFQAEKNEVQCICKSFEFKGILCRHGICVLDNNDVCTLNAKYVLNHWRKNFKRLHLSESVKESTVVPPCAPRDRYDDVYLRCHELAEIGSWSEEHYKYSLSRITKVKEELLAFVPMKNTMKEGHGNIDSPVNTVEEGGAKPIHDPLHKKCKGRPRSTRLKSITEKITQRKMK